MDETIEKFLSERSKEVQELAQGARVLIKGVVPEPDEKMIRGYGSIMYGPGARMSQQLVYIAPHSAHVNIGFMKGTTLPDPNGLLEGTGKMMRHVKLRRPADLEKPGLSDLIRVALQPQG